MTSSASQQRTCIVCGERLSGGLQSWHSRCSGCGYESGALMPAINEAQAHRAISEEDREVGLKTLRIENFKALMSLIESTATLGAEKRLLDVGAAHGWFLEEARSSFDVLGIEPDIAVSSLTLARGLPIRRGYFPEALQAEETFDVIVFNDVIEHIPDLDQILTACNSRLRQDGILVLNLPNSKGLFYRLAKFLVRIKWTGPFERMWQKNFPSPHVHFFDVQNLTRLVTKYGFLVIQSAELPSMRAKGLLQRIRYANNAGFMNFFMQYLGSLFVLPWTKLFPSDVIVCIYRKNNFPL